MQELLHKKSFRVISSSLILMITFLILGYTPLNEIHGRSDAALIVAVVGGIGLIISNVCNFNSMIIATSLGYVVSAFIGKAMESEGMVFDNAPIHTMWIVWLVSYVVIIMIGLAVDFIVKLKSKRSVRGFIGLVVSIGIIIVTITSYMTKPVSINEIFAHRPNFYGSVIEVRENYLLLEVDKNSFVARSGDKITVGFSDIMTDLSVKSDDFKTGDIVRVYFDGSVAESDPLQAGRTYIISNTDTQITKDGIEKNGDLYSYEEISTLMGKSVDQLKQYSLEYSAQFKMDFLNSLMQKYLN